MRLDCQILLNRPPKLTSWVRPYCQTLHRNHWDKTRGSSGSIPLRC